MAETKRDYYETLGVPRTADADAIKKAYRKLTKECHPDLHPGDKAKENRFKEVNDAYEVLSDSEKKALYDQYGHAGIDPSYAAGQGGGFNGGFGFGDIDLGSIFDSFFGGGFGGSHGRTRQQKGESIRANLTIDFAEAAFGCEKEVKIPRVESCGDCGGTGAEAGSSVETCTVCKGSGQTRTTRQTQMGVIQSTGVCSACNGKGKTINNPCHTCNGSGAIRTQATLKIKVPAGIDDGQTISMRGQGSQGSGGGSSGDLLVTILIRPHPFFTREGTTVHYEVPISITQAAIGCKLEVPTLDGRVKYTIPEGTQPNTVFRLKGKGIPSISGGGRGDQLVHVTVEIPRKLNKQQKDALLQFEAASAGKK